jgi:hypothetical protein
MYAYKLIKPISKNFESNFPNHLPIEPPYSRLI